MALNQLGLGFVFTAKDLASGVIGRVKEKFGELEGKTTAATKSVDAMATREATGVPRIGPSPSIPSNPSITVAPQNGRSRLAVRAMFI